MLPTRFTTKVGTPRKTTCIVQPATRNAQKKEEVIKATPKHSGRRKWWDLKDTKTGQVIGYIVTGTDGILRFDPLHDSTYGSKVLTSIANILKRLNNQP